MSDNKRLSPSLSLLLAASAALTCQKQAMAEEAAPTQYAGYRFTVYDEDALSAQNFKGDPKRYHVDSQQFALNVNLADRNTLKLDATHEVMSGSSPWFILPGADHRPIQVMSGATIHDHRNELKAALVHDNGGNSTSTYSASYSLERDYRAVSLGAERSVPLNTALTLGFGGSFSHDIIEPTDALLYDRVQHEEKNSASAFGSLAWVLNRTTVLQSGLQLTVEDGYLSDPYKLATVNNALLPDTRPDRRTEAAWLVRYRYAATESGSLHADFRLAWNSWGQFSQTAELAWYQTLPGGWRLIPGVRYYNQDQARFYAPFFDNNPIRYYSSDYRLGAYGAFAVNLNARKRIGNWELSIGAERYHATTHYAIGGGDLADPALVSFTRMFAGLDFLFD